MLLKKRKLLYLWKIYGDVLCVLDCIVGNVPPPLFFFFSKCAVLGDSDALLEKSWGNLLKRGYSGPPWKVALNPLPMVLYLICFRNMR